MRDLKNYNYTLGGRGDDEFLFGKDKPSLDFLDSPDRDLFNILFYNFYFSIIRRFRDYPEVNNSRKFPNILTNKLDNDLSNESIDPLYSNLRDVFSLIKNSQSDKTFTKLLKRAGS